MKTLEPETTTFETDGSFTLILENHGQPAHVHLHVDDSLADVVKLAEPNVYVEAGDIETVDVTVAEGRSGRGAIDVSTGYGAEETRIDVRVEPNGESASETDTETESEPTARAADRTETEALSRLVLPALYAAGGILLTVALVTLVGDFAALILGAFALLVAIGAAGYLLLET